MLLGEGEGDTGMLLGEGEGDTGLCIFLQAVSPLTHSFRSIRGTKPKRIAAVATSAPTMTQTIVITVFFIAPAPLPQPAIGRSSRETTISCFPIISSPAARFQ